MDESQLGDQIAKLSNYVTELLVRVERLEKELIETHALVQRNFQLISTRDNLIGLWMSAEGLRILKELKSNKKGP